MSRVCFKSRCCRRRVAHLSQLTWRFRFLMAPKKRPAGAAFKRPSAKRPSSRTDLRNSGAGFLGMCEGRVVCWKPVGSRVIS